MFTYLVHADKCEGVNVMIFSWWICTEPTNYCPSKSVTSAPVHWKVGIEKTIWKFDVSTWPFILSWTIKSSEETRVPCTEGLNNTVHEVPLI